MLAAGDRAPDFELPDLSQQAYRLADALGQGTVLVVFWKTSCKTCDVAFPYLQRLAEAYEGGSWQLLGISQEGTAESAAFAERYGITFPVLIDSAGWPVSKEYDPEATPTMFLIDPDGVVEAASVGFSKADLNDMSARVATHLGRGAEVVARDDDGGPPFMPG